MFCKARVADRGEPRSRLATPQRAHDCFMSGPTLGARRCCAAIQCCRTPTARRVRRLVLPPLINFQEALCAGSHDVLPGLGRLAVPAPPAAGGRPCQRLKARWKALCSEKPSRRPISPIDSEASRRCRSASAGACRPRIDESRCRRRAAVAAGFVRRGSWRRRHRPGRARRGPAARRSSPAARRPGHGRRAGPGGYRSGPRAPWRARHPASAEARQERESKRSRWPGA